jgi:dihydrodipicolinate synthase/N-acetylneuraminate lyase
MLSGAFVAAVTPFDEKGEVDYPGFARLLAWFEHAGLDGVVVAGTNGEGPSLSGPEKRDLCLFAVRHAGNLKVIAGLATCSLPEAVWLSEQARKAGAVATLAMPPFYFRSAMEEGVLAWFRGLFEASELPCILYNFPKMTGFTFTAGHIVELSQYGHFAGIKDSSGDPALLAKYLGACPGKSVFVGNETLISQCLAGGGAGTISGLANSMPRHIARLVRERTDVLQTQVDSAVANIKCHPQPAVHKFVLDTKGMPGGLPRPPLVPLPAEAGALVRAFMERSGF